MKRAVQLEAEQRAFVRKLIAAEILARRGQGPLALRPPAWPPGERPLEVGGLEPKR